MTAYTQRHNPHDQKRNIKDCAVAPKRTRAIDLTEYGLEMTDWNKYTVSFAGITFHLVSRGQQGGLGVKETDIDFEQGTDPLEIAQRLKEAACQARIEMTEPDDHQAPEQQYGLCPAPSQPGMMIG